MLPNYTHKFLKQLEDKKKIIHIITQNVDNLHTKAESKNVLELHGSAYVVRCLKCNYTIDRHQFQEVLSSLNQHISITELYSVRPDGDVELTPVRKYMFNYNTWIITYKIWIIGARYYNVILYNNTFFLLISKIQVLIFDLLWKSIIYIV